MKRFVSLFIAWVMLAQTAAFATPPFPEKMQKALNELVGANGRTYSSNGAIDVLLDEYLTSRPTGATPRNALNLALSSTPALNTAPMATLVIVIDDQSKEWFNGTVGAAAASIRTIMKQNHLVAGFSVGAYYIEARAGADTVTSSLSVTNLKNLRDHDGDEIGSGGYFEGTMGGANGGWWHGNSGKLAVGNYTKAQLDAAMDLHFAGNRRALEDTLGFKEIADWHSASNSSASDITSPYAQAAGFKYVVSTYANTSSTANKQNSPYPQATGPWGMWGTQGAFTQTMKLSAYPGNHGSRWEIAQSMAESNDTSYCYKATRFAMITNGLIVYNLHKASDHETALAGTNGWRDLCQYWGGLIAAGRLRCVVPSVGFKMYYNDQWSDGVSWSTSKFRDLDGEQHLDLWCSGASGATPPQAAASDTALLNKYSTAALFKYAGEPTRRLNWTGAGSATGLFSIVATPDSSWEKTNAMKVVYPPAGAGWTIMAECRAICDTTVAGAVRPAAAGDIYGINAGAKYIGIDFLAPLETNSFTYTANPTAGFHLTSASGTSLQMSMANTTLTTRPGTPFTFGTRNNAHRAGREWLFLTSSWDIPGPCSYIFVNVFKQPILPANEVIITDPVIRFYNRNTGEVIDVQ